LLTTTKSMLCLDCVTDNNGERDDRTKDALGQHSL